MVEITSAHFAIFATFAILGAILITAGVCYLYWGRKHRKLGGRKINHSSHWSDEL